MKHSLIILISLLLLSSPVIGNNHKGETLYRWGECCKEDYKWMGFGDVETNPVYGGQVKDGKPNGLGILIFISGTKYVGSWENGEELEGTLTSSSGTKYVGSWKNREYWNGTLSDEDGKIYGKVVNGEYIKQ